MSGTIPVPLKTHKNEKWGALDSWGNQSVEVVAMRFGEKAEQHGFMGGHRVRMYKLHHCVHFKVPLAALTMLDITDVQPSQAPPALPRPVVVSRHGKKGR
jgi:hypothetical protein